MGGWLHERAPRPGRIGSLRLEARFERGASPDAVANALCRADLHGAMVKVATATCPSHKDVQGLVVMETKNTLQILGKDNTLRVIPKLGSSFTFVVSGYLFTIPGASIDSKPAERATKKLKNKVPLDF